MSRILQGEGHQVAGQRISWAGESPWTGGLCLGSESGNLYFPSTTETQMISEIVPVGVASEAVNGVAFLGKNVAVTSRNEIEIGYLLDLERLQIKRCPHSFRGGAHGVVSSSQGLFLAPLGTDGVLLLEAAGDQPINPLVTQLADEPKNFYRLKNLGLCPDGEVVVCASRRDGLLAFCLENGRPSGPLVGHHFHEFDIIDVCPIGNADFPLAVACVSRSRDIFLIKNVLEEHAPFALSYRELKGAAYSLLSAHGGLFLLTDHYLATLPDIARKFLADEPIDTKLSVSLMPTESTEALLLGDHSVLLAGEEVVTVLAVDMLLRNLPGQASAASHKMPRAHAGARAIEVSSPISQAHRKNVDAGWSGIRRSNLIVRPAA